MSYAVYSQYVTPDMVFWKNHVWNACNKEEQVFGVFKYGCTDHVDEDDEYLLQGTTHEPRIMTLSLLIMPSYVR